MATRKLKTVYVAFLMFLLGSAGLEPRKNMDHGKLTLCSPLSSNNIGSKEKSFNPHNFH